MDNDADHRCRVLAASQHGVLDRAQALAAGLSRQGIARRVASGAWERVLPSVYRVAGTPVTWFQQLMAAVLWAGPGAAVSHRAAAALYGLPGFKRGAAEVSTCQRRQGAPPWTICHQVGELPRRHLGSYQGIPLTSPDRTLLDLAGLRDVSPGDIERALDELLRRGLAARFRVAWTADHARSPGRWLLQRLMEARLPGYVPPNGELEAKFLALIKRAGLPMPEREEVLEDGGFRGRVDFLWPEFLVAVETDGFRWHASRHAWERDLTKSNLLARKGYRPMRVTWEAVTERPAEVIESLTDLFRDPG